MSKSLNACNNIEDLRKRACRRLPAPMFHYIDGAADDEWSMARNTRAFNDYELLPSQLSNVQDINLQTSLLDTKLGFPFILAPTGMSRLFHHDKEPAVAKAASKFETLYSLSTLATTSIEDISETSAGPKMFQIYIFKDRGLTREFVERCKAAKYQALCLTVDSPVGGNRERDLDNGMSVPPKFGLRSLWSFATHPRWVMNSILHSDFGLANVSGTDGGGSVSLIQYVNRQFDPSVTWDDAAWLAEQWPGPFVIKGLQSPSDARRAVEIGASAIMVSNHGGRQLDGTAAPIDCVAPIRDAIGDALELIVDGGIRRGTHILKAIALGANACSIGRPYLFGLAAGGQRGVERVLHLLREELARDMALLGCRSIDDVTADKVLHRGRTLNAERNKEIKINDH